VLWHCWMGIRKSNHPAKIESWGVGGGTIWSEGQTIGIWFSWCYCQPNISCFIKIHIGLTLAYQAVPEKEAIKQVSVYEQTTFLMPIILPYPCTSPLPSFLCLYLWNSPGDLWEHYKLGFQWSLVAKWHYNITWFNRLNWKILSAA